ncbi:TPA: serine hydrolase family protein [archaeon]|nr:serine hydrolase family protein [Candidatus Naiadarchaeales archaeon SRR2090153.bin461]
MNFLILHGYGGYPNENWFPWLKEELEKLGHIVEVPQLPESEKPDLGKWMDEVAKYDEIFGGDLIIIGHSMGVTLGLRKLETIENPIKAFISVAGFAEKLDSRYDKVVKTFMETQFDWEKIKQNCKSFYVYQSDNDSYVPVQAGEKLSKNLGAEFILVKNAGHFNSFAGYNKFESLLEKIKTIL